MPDRQLAASMPACFACPAYICLIDTTLNNRPAPASWFHTPWTPGTPAFSISSQIIAAFTTARATVKFDGGRDGMASVMIGSLR